MSRRVGLVFVAALLAACQGGSPTIPPAAPATTAPASVAAVVTPPPATATPRPKPLVLPRTVEDPLDGSCEVEGPGCLGLLEAGKPYTTRTFKPTLTFAVPTADWVNPNEAGGEMALFSTKDVGDVIFFGSLARSTDPKVGTTFDEIVAWLQAYDKISVTTPETASIGGLTGVWMDVVVRTGAVSTLPDCPVQVCVPMLRGDDPSKNNPYPWHWTVAVAGTQKIRLYLLQANASTVAISLESPDGLTIDALIETFDAMAPTIKFDLGG